MDEHDRGPRMGRALRRLVDIEEERFAACFAVFDILLNEFGDGGVRVLRRGYTRRGRRCRLRLSAQERPERHNKRSQQNKTQGGTNEHWEIIDEGEIGILGLTLVRTKLYDVSRTVLDTPAHAP